MTGRRILDSHKRITKVPKQNSSLNVTKYSETGTIGRDERSESSGNEKSVSVVEDRGFCTTRGRSYV